VTGIFVALCVRAGLVFARMVAALVDINLPVLCCAAGRA
jgi:hypothetical protein